MNAFLSTLEKYDIEKDILRRGELTTLQANMGNLCNQNCAHCHIEASPQRKDIMSKKVINDILIFLKGNNIKTLDITGGAPELNPGFEYFVESARPLVTELIVRSNLTALLEKGKEHLPEFLMLNKAHLICSLPCYTKENVDLQRGNGVFEKSIKALHILNNIGFGKEDGLYLDLTHNPNGPFLPKAQSELEEDYKHFLKTRYGITFNRLIALTNAPINRFKNY